jgi:hypothetical protein
VLAKNRHEKWDSTWDSRGTPPKNLSQSIPDDGTAKSASNQQANPAVPLSQTLGRGTMGHPPNDGILLGTGVGQHYASVLARVSHCSASVPPSAA